MCRAIYRIFLRYRYIIYSWRVRRITRNNIPENLFQVGVGVVRSVRVLIRFSNIIHIFYTLRAVKPTIYAMHIYIYIGIV